MSVPAATVLHDAVGDHGIQSQTLIQLVHQKQTAVGGDTRTLETNFQTGGKRELKALILCFVHRAEVSANLVLRSNPHEYWRWLDHTATYADFKKECGLNITS